MPLTQVVNFLKSTDELTVAKELLNTFAKYSNSLEQYDTLGMLYEKIKAYPQSLDMLNKCLVMAQNPQQLHSIRANLAKVHNHLNNPKQSLFYSDINLSLNPDDYEAEMEQSFSYYLLGNSQKSYEIQTRLINNPAVSEQLKRRITFNMGTFEMQSGNFKVGLRKMIMGGKEIGIWQPINKPYPKWTGANTDSTVLVFAEAGIGDEIINIRFMDEFKKRNIKAIWVDIRPELKELFNSNGFSCITQNEIDPFGDYVYCESMSLPILLDMEREQLWTEPYLQPKAEYIEKWKKILPEKFVTLRWAGNELYDADLARKVDYEQLVTKVGQFNIPLVSLQIDNNARPDDTRLINVKIESWDDTLAIQHLALLNITSCTSVAHSASASNAKCVVLPPIATYYPWLHLKMDNTSWWYGENTLCFPQRTHNDWTESIDFAVNHLKTLI